MKHKKKRKGVTNYAPRCPYCGSTTVYRSATGIYTDNPDDVMLYVCTYHRIRDSQDLTFEREFDGFFRYEA